MKKSITLLVVTLLVLFSFTPTSSAFNYFDKYKVDVTYNGAVQDFSPNAAIWGNYTIVPFRQLFELYGAEVTWDNSTKTVTAVKDDMTIILKNESNKAIVNGKEVVLAQGTFTANGAIYVGLRFISETLGAKVTFDKKNNMVHIVTEEE